jgi:hypothetical protein
MGYTGGLNWYRTSKLNWKLMAAWHNAPLAVRSLFITRARLRPRPVRLLSDQGPFCGATGSVGAAGSRSSAPISNLNSETSGTVGRDGLLRRTSSPVTLTIGVHHYRAVSMISRREAAWRGKTPRPSAVAACHHRFLSRRFAAAFKSRCSQSVYPEFDQLRIRALDS